MKTVLCFGDSNTWGYSPVDAERFPRDVRWPGVTRNALGDGYLVIEEGLNGRTTVWDDPLGDHWNGREYFIPCLDTHRPVDLVTIMLGTNDLKKRFSLTAFDIAYGAGLLADICLESIAGPDGGPPQVLLVSPVLIKEVGPWAEMFEGAAEKSALMAERYKAMADERGIHFFDGATVAEPSDLDGIHLEPAGHKALGEAIAQCVREILG